MRVNKFYIFNSQIDNLTKQEAINKSLKFLKEEGTRLIFTPNPEIVLKAKKSSAYAKILNTSDMNLPDGYGLVWASRLLGTPLRERVAGVDFLVDLLTQAETHHYRCHLVLLDTGLVSASDLKLFFLKNFPRLEYTTRAISQQYLASGHVLDDIKNNRPDILIVNFGAPQQEEWLVKNKKRLPTVKVALGVGGALDMLTNKIKRAPKFMQNIHLEWLWRLLQQPGRIKRIINAVLIFGGQVILLKIKSLLFFRLNVLAFIYKNRNTILIIHKSRGWGGWSMVQGGVNKHEPTRQALRREIEEEIGIKNILITAASRHTHWYRWSNFYKNFYHHQYAGQRQHCFFVKFTGEDKEIKLNFIDNENIDDYRWVNPKEMLELIEPSRKYIIQKLLTEFIDRKIYEKK